MKFSTVTGTGLPAGICATALVTNNESIVAAVNVASAAMMVLLMADSVAKARPRVIVTYAASRLQEM